ncbi:MAG: AAA family ATPase [Anaerolineaceae bacterium]|nr:AAA family ATPase [Anaerolineaceae bacterium]
MTQDSNEIEKVHYIQTFLNVGEELKNYHDQDSHELEVFGPYTRVNIFVGATNSGKSRLMRGLAKSAPFNVLSLDPELGHPHSFFSTCFYLRQQDFRISINTNSEKRSLQNEDQDILAQLSPHVLKHIRRFNGRTSRTTINGPFFQQFEDEFRAWLAGNRPNDQNQIREFEYKAELITIAINTLSKNDEEWIKIEKQNLTSDIEEKMRSLASYFEALTINSLNQISPPKIVYIPTLRTATWLNGVTDVSDKIGAAVSQNYKLNEKSKREAPNVPVEVFSGNNLYSTVLNEKSGEAFETRRLKQFEKFLIDNFFEDQEMEFKALREGHTLGKRLALYITDENSSVDRPFMDLGEGIQAIVILMYKLFTAEDGTWILIEEPEQGLHPGLQRIFLETLATNKIITQKNLTIFMTTHSNHLVGLATSELKDISVFSFQRRLSPERFEVRPIFSPKSPILDLLGVTNSSVFLANCGVWVEGITDRRYLNAYLLAYLDSEEFKNSSVKFIPKEDIHYAFFEYGGSNIVHYEFEEEAIDTPSTDKIRAQFLCNRVFLLSDKDSKKEKKHKIFRAAQSENFMYETTPGLEVENLISNDQIKLLLPQLISNVTLESIEKLEIDIENNKDLGIGKYLKELLGDKCPSQFAVRSGTLSSYYKDKLSHLTSEIVIWENMSEDAKQLTRKLYSFILKHNSPALRKTAVSEKI